MQEQFKDVGLMTGDVTINPSASCIVMTTEVSPTVKQKKHNCMWRAPLVFGDVGDVGDIIPRVI